MNDTKTLRGNAEGFLFLVVGPRCDGLRRLYHVRYGAAPEQRTGNSRYPQDRRLLPESGASARPAQGAALSRGIGPRAKRLCMAPKCAAGCRAAWRGRKACLRRLRNPLARRCPRYATRGGRCGKNSVDCSNRAGCAPISDLLGAGMTTSTAKNQPAVLDVVALLADLSSQNLARGQVGTVVELLDEKSVLVEFTDDQGEGYAIVPCPRSELLVLHYVPQAA